MPFIPPNPPPRENGKPQEIDSNEQDDSAGCQSDENSNSMPQSPDLHEKQISGGEKESSANDKAPKGDSSAQVQTQDETEETLADALRKLISHRFKQKIDEQRQKPENSSEKSPEEPKPTDKTEEKPVENPKKSFLRNSEKTLSVESASSRSSRGSKKSMTNSQSSRKSHLGARKNSSAFDFNSDSELSDYAVEVEIRSACSDYSYDEWIEDSNSDDCGDPFNLETFKSMPNIKTIREPHSETISEPTKKEPVQKSVDFAHEKVNIGNRKIWKQNSHPRGLARHSFASLQDSQRAYTLSRDPSRESFASYSGQMVPNYGLYQNPSFQSEIMSKSMSRMDSYDPGDLSESAMSSASSHFTKIFQPPKSKPPPPPMPFAERTIYVHVKNEKELEPEKTEKVSIFGQRVVISNGAKTAISNASRTVSMESGYEQGAVPVPLPTGQEVAAIWASNMQYPSAPAVKYKHELQESYALISQSEFTKKQKIGKEEILAVLDLPGLTATEIEAQKSRKKSRRSKKDLIVKPITITVEKSCTLADK